MPDEISSPRTTSGVGSDTPVCKPKSDSRSSSHRSTSRDSSISLPYIFNISVTCLTFERVEAPESDIQEDLATRWRAMRSPPPGHIHNTLCPFWQLGDTPEGEAQGGSRPECPEHKTFTRFDYNPFTKEGVAHTKLLEVRDQTAKDKKRTKIRPPSWWTRTSIAILVLFLLTFLWGLVTVALVLHLKAYDRNTCSESESEGRHHSPYRGGSGVEVPRQLLAHISASEYRMEIGTHPLERIRHRRASSESAMSQVVSSVRSTRTVSEKGRSGTLGFRLEDMRAGPLPDHVDTMGSMKRVPNPGPESASRLKRIDTHPSLELP
ncbi:hypothetical protein K504DRAFT_455593 [Pleomassaria siparia CBS 279.74]|uniref:Uncharacterized protein n=1 Tax=Pleomassaria siparia CBS 279.74 TaxID=1314801 RepID=A0A6G1K777_9PLEO|nr:hypothetical protein K504DRAFT_455593 [Pleomassaria siparia CBS 279.74]